MRFVKDGGETFVRFLGELKDRRIQVTGLDNDPVTLSFADMLLLQPVYP